MSQVFLTNVRVAARAGESRHAARDNADDTPRSGSRQNACASASLKIFFHPNDIIAQPHVAVATVEKWTADGSGVERGLGIEDVVDRELNREAPEEKFFVLGAEGVGERNVVIRLRRDAVAALRSR